MHISRVQAAGASAVKLWSGPRRLLQPKKQRAAQDEQRSRALAGRGTGELGAGLPPAVAVPARRRSDGRRVRFGFGPNGCVAQSHNPLLPRSRAQNPSRPPRRLRPRGAHLPAAATSCRTAAAAAPGPASPGRSRLDASARKKFFSSKWEA